MCEMQSLMLVLTTHMCLSILKMICLILFNSPLSGKKKTPPLWGPRENLQPSPQTQVIRTSSDNPTSTHHSGNKCLLSATESSFQDLAVLSTGAHAQAALLLWALSLHSLTSCPKVTLSSLSSFPSAPMSRCPSKGWRGVLSQPDKRRVKTQT